MLNVMNQTVEDRKKHLYMIMNMVPDGGDGKESTCNAGDSGSIPGLGGSPGEGNGNPLQYSIAWRMPCTEEPGGLQSMGLQSWTRLSPQAHEHGC